MLQSLEPRSKASSFLVKMPTTQIQKTDSQLDCPAQRQEKLPVFALVDNHTNNSHK